jgi:hypothetical protein
MLAILNQWLTSHFTGKNRAAVTSVVRPCLHTDLIDGHLMSEQARARVSIDEAIVTEGDLGSKLKYRDLGSKLKYTLYIIG